MASVFAGLALVGIAAAVAALIALHVVPTGLSPVHDPVSAYGISRWRWLYRSQTIATAVAAASLAFALLAAHLDAVTAPVIALVLLAISRAPIGWVPMDADGSPRTPTGRWHNVLAALAFASATVGAFVVGVPLSASGNETAARACGLVGWFMTAASAVTIPALSVRALRPALGPAERLIYVGMFSWMTIAGIDLLTR